MFSQIDNHFVRYCTIINYYCFVRFRQQKTVTWRGFWQKSPRRLGQSSADFQVMWYLVPFVSFIMLSDCTCAGTIRGAATKGCKPADAGPRKCLLWAVLAWPAEHLCVWSDSTRPWVLNSSGIESVCANVDIDPLYLFSSRNHCDGVEVNLCAL